MNVSYVDGIVVAFCREGLLLSIYLGQTDLAQTISAGLVGYLGGSATKAIVSKNKEDVGE